MLVQLLPFHSFLRWLILLALVFSLARAYRGWLTKQNVLKFDRLLNIVTLILLYSQFIIGLFLYFSSPLVHYFLHHFKEAVHIQNIRFFGMEHITSMSVAILLISVGSFKAKRKRMDCERFKTQALWFTVALLIIFLSIPWSFSPFTSRPEFRGF